MSHRDPLTGLILDKDGKVCKTCNSLKDMARATKNFHPGITEKENPEVIDERPPDIEQLGRSSWTLLHSIAAKYPEDPTEKERYNMLLFVKLFSELYPCGPCAEDFKTWINKGNLPDVQSQERLSRWFCDAHNEGNCIFLRRSYAYQGRILFTNL